MNMNLKLMLSVMVAMLAFSGCIIIVDDAGESDAATSITIEYRPYYDGSYVDVTTPTTTDTIYSQQTVTFTESGIYTFDVVIPSNSSYFFSHYRVTGTLNGSSVDYDYTDPNMTINATNSTLYILPILYIKPPSYVTYSLDLTHAPSGAYVTVTSDDSATRTVYSGSSSNITFEEEDELTYFTAYAPSGYTFYCWDVIAGSYYDGIFDNPVQYTNFVINEGYTTVVTPLFTTNPYVVNFTATTGGFVTPTVLSSDNMTDTFSSTASAYPHYTFDGWYNSNNVRVSTNTTLTGNIYDNRGETFEARFSPIMCTVTFISNNNSYGTVSPSFVSVQEGTVFLDWYTNGVNWIEFVGTNYTATATPAASTQQYTYIFDSWSPSGGTVNSNMTITANFTRIGSSSIMTTFYPNHSVIDDYPITSIVQTIGNTFILPADPVWTDHVFIGWYDSRSAGVQITSSTVVTSNSPTDIYAQWTGLNTITFQSNDPGYGSVSESTLTVGDNATVTVINDTLMFTNTTVHEGLYYVTATPAADTSRYSYAFSSWSGVPLNGYITQDITITANFVRTELPVSDVVYWSNNLQNGSVDITFRFTGGSSNMSHSMKLPLYSGTTDDTNETTWTATGNYVKIDTSYYPRTNITVGLYDSDNVQIIPVVTRNMGQWATFTLNIDADRGTLTFVPVDRFEDFTAFRTMDSQSSVIMDWSSTTNKNSILEIIHYDNGNGQHVSFQVTNTETFLNTYGVVMTNPSLNVYDYFPQYSSVRVNFYAFALFGESMTVNGHTFPVTDGSVTIHYTTDGTTNSIAALNAEGVQTKTFTLSNIYVTWENDRCSLTFVNDKFTVDLGTFSAGSETVSFVGQWYFTSYLYEPYTVTEREISWDWKTMPDIGGTAMLLVFLGVLLIGGLIAHMKLGLKWLDMVICIAGFIIAYTILG